MYVLRCSITSGPLNSVRCPSEYTCDDFPKGIRFVYRLGWKFASYQGGKKRFICDRHPTEHPSKRSYTVAEPLVRQSPTCVTLVNPVEGLHAGIEIRVNRNMTRAEALVGRLGNTHMKMVYSCGDDRHALWGLQFRDDPSPIWSEPHVFYVARDGPLLANPLPVTAPVLLNRVITVGTLEEMIFSTHSAICRRVGMPHERQGLWEGPVDAV